MSWYLAVLRKYAEFDGRARRMEYWMFTLVNMLIIIGIVALRQTTGPGGETLFGLVFALYFLAIALPSIAVSIRRLHDTGRSGWWLLISFVPIIGPIWLLVLTVLDSEAGENRYGPNPKMNEMPSMRPGPTASRA